MALGIRNAIEYRIKDSGTGLFLYGISCTFQFLYCSRLRLTAEFNIWTIYCHGKEKKRQVV